MPFEPVWRVLAVLSEAKRDELTAILLCALPVVGKARTSDHALWFQMFALRNEPSTAAPQLLALLGALKSEPALQVIEHAHRCALGHSARFDVYALIYWLLARAQCVGAAQAISDLTCHLESDTVELLETLAIDGLTVAANTSFGEHELWPWEALAMSEAKWRIAVAEAYGAAGPTAVLVRRHRVPRAQNPSGADRATEPALSLEPAIDILRCATAVAGVGYRLRHLWFEPDPSTPWPVNLSSFGVDSSTLPLPTQMHAADLEALRVCVARFSALTESHRSRLRIPLDYLNRSYVAGHRHVDAAIELGIAVESLFAPTKLSDGIGFAVRTRAARFLGGSLEARQRTAAIVRDVYDLRSLAVHSGRFNTESANKKWRDSARVDSVLRDGQRLVGQSLLKVIQHGEPSWEDLDLGASTIQPE